MKHFHTTLHKNWCIIVKSHANLSFFLNINGYHYQFDLPFAPNVNIRITKYAKPTFVFVVALSVALRREVDKQITLLQYAHGMVHLIWPLRPVELTTCYGCCSVAFHIFYMHQIPQIGESQPSNPTTLSNFPSNFNNKNHSHQVFELIVDAIHHLRALITNICSTRHYRTLQGFGYRCPE